MELKDIIAKNLVTYRKQAKLTQQELAEKLNYSDKSVSKWERGEGIPDAIVLKQLADLYGVTVDDLLTEHDENEVVVPQTKTVKRQKHWLIALLSAGLVWLVATITFVVLNILLPDIGAAKYCFIAALPAMFIVLLVFAVLWAKPYVAALTVSGLVWTSCLVLHVLVLPNMPNTFFIYLVGAALQVLVILWYWLVYVLRKPK